MRRAVGLPIAFVLAASLAGPLAAAEPMTVSINSHHLVAKIVVNVEVGFSCQPKPEVDSPWYSRWGNMGGMSVPIIEVDIRQAVGGHMQAFGGTSWYFDPEELCTGEPQTVLLSIVPDSSGPAFKPGWAAIQVTGYSDYWIGNEEDWTQSYDVDQRDSTGWIRIKLGK
jgi:hypothetical protein